MPIYEYQCSECNNKFELLRHFLNTDNVSCPKCDSAKVEKILSKFSCGNTGVNLQGCNSNISA